MENLKVTLKRFFSNKNTVSIICGVLAILVLYIGYNIRIKSLTDPISVPYALNTINPGEQITSGDVGTTNVPKSMIKGSVITTASSVIGKYANADSVIPQGSLFYSRSVVSKESLPGVQAYDYPEGHVLVNLDVNMSTTYGNLVYPGNYIDIYLKAVNKIDEENITSDTKDMIMVGKLIENVKVLAVVDANGDNVFSNLEQKGSPAMVLFAVPEEYHILLRKAMYLRTYEATLIPVPTKESLKTEPGEVAISSENLKNFINKVTVWDDSYQLEDTPLVTE